jgi:hypothetical protein
LGILRGSTGERGKRRRAAEQINLSLRHNISNTIQQITTPIQHHITFNMSNNRSRGRIHVYQRDVNDATPILGADIQMGETVTGDLQETLKLRMEDGTRVDYRRRLHRIIEFWEENYSNYYAVGVVKVLPEDLIDPSKYYFDRFKTDLKYDGLNVKMVLAFLVYTKDKGDGKIKGHTDIRKYKDAILWGALTAKEKLPTSFYTGIEAYLKSYKRLTQNAKKKGNLDETSSDPITVALYVLILAWSIEAGNIFVWFWSITQWSVMGRCASVDPLGFHNFKLAGDSNRCKYDESKADKEGEKLSEKNIYANPIDWRCCWWTAFSIYACLQADSLAKSEKLFLHLGKKEGSAAQRYQEQLVGILDEHAEEVEMHIRVEHLNAYGLRKGSATHATTGTTCPPPLPSVARRGEWSLGAVLDVYWHFSDAGDQYLGRVLALLDPNKASFAILPPHWKMTKPLDNANISTAFNLCCWPIIEAYKGKENDPSRMLLRCLASMVFHSEKILEVATSDPGHPFNKIPLLRDLPLLNRIKGFVTTDPTPGVMEHPTGIPPHVQMAVQIKSLIEQVSQLMVAVQGQTQAVVTAVTAAIDKKSWEAGHVTPEQLANTLTKWKDDITSSFITRVDDLQDKILTAVGGETNQRQAPTTQTNNCQGGCVFLYDSRFWDVPKNFKFPTGATLRQGLEFWLKGQIVSPDGKQYIKPFRLLKQARLPASKLKNDFKLVWSPLYRFLESNAAMLLPNITRTMTVEDIQATYTTSISFLRGRVSYCFVGLPNNHNAETWKISTWANRISRSSIEKRGTAADKALLPAATNRNHGNPISNTRKRTASKNPLYPRRQARTKAGNTATGSGGNAGNSGPNAAAGGGGNKKDDDEDQGDMVACVAGAACKFRGLVAAYNTCCSKCHQHSHSVCGGRHWLGDAGGEEWYCNSCHGKLKKPPPVSKVAVSKKEPGRCSIVDCTNLNLCPDHPCFACGHGVHNFCAQSADLLAVDNELNMYCSLSCKKSKPG